MLALNNFVIVKPQEESKKDGALIVSTTDNSSVLKGIMVDISDEICGDRRPGTLDINKTVYYLNKDIIEADDIEFGKVHIVKFENLVGYDIQ